MYYYLFLQTGATPKEYCEMEMGASDLVSADNLNDNVESGWILKSSYAKRNSPAAWWTLQW